jgi:hypothetical protein
VELGVECIIVTAGIGIIYLNRSARNDLINDLPELVAHIWLAFLIYNTIVPSYNSGFIIL